MGGGTDEALREFVRQNCGRLHDVLFTKDQAFLVVSYSGLGIWSGFGILFLPLTNSASLYKLPNFSKSQFAYL